MFLLDFGHFCLMPSLALLGESKGSASPCPFVPDRIHFESCLMTVPAELHLKQGFIRHADQKMHPKAHGQMSKVSHVCVPGGHLL